MRYVITNDNKIFDSYFAETCEPNPYERKKLLIKEGNVVEVVTSKYIQKIQRWMDTTETVGTLKLETDNILDCIMYGDLVFIKDKTGVILPKYLYKDIYGLNNVERFIKIHGRKIVEIYRKTEADTFKRVAYKHEKLWFLSEV